MKTALVLLVTIAAVFGSAVPRLGFPSFEYSEITGRVVGGKEAVPNSAPHILSLQVRQFLSNSHFCGATIIAPSWGVTAAHCMVYSTIIAVAGAHNVGSGTQTRNVVKQIKHPQYSGGVGPYDIALIKMDKPFTYDSKVQPIALPAAGSIQKGEVTLNGWGSVSTTNTASMPKNLQTINKPIVDYAECEAHLGGAGASPLHPTNTCTGPLTGGVSACSGDSGGPLTQGNVLVGVVSWGYIPCGGKYPSVYTRVSAFNDWIAQNMD